MRGTDAPQRGLVFDVGMHLGEDTDFYLRKGYRVVGFEANPQLLELNRRRFATELADGRVTIVGGAISPTPDEPVTFFVHPTKSDWGTTDAAWVERNRGGSVEVTVPGVDFGQALAEHGTPWYLKIDIEGADQHCLRTLAAFEERPAYLSIESEKEDWDALLAELDLLGSLGYSRFAAVQQASIPGSVHDGRTLTGDRIVHRFDAHSSGGFGEDVEGWRSREAVVAAYERIFRRYRLLGDRSRLGGSRLGGAALLRLEHTIRRPLPGWYDTHASRVGT